MSLVASSRAVTSASSDSASARGTVRPVLAATYLCAADKTCRRRPLSAAPKVAMETGAGAAQRAGAGAGSGAGAAAATDRD